MPTIFSSCYVREFGGAFTHDPEEIHSKASPGAKNLVNQAFEDIYPDHLVDYHTHILGTGTSDSGTFVSHEMLSWMHPQKRLKFKIYISASGINDLDKVDQQYVQRLVRLIRSIKNHGRFRILAFDKNYNLDGSVNLDKTEFYVPNEYIFKLTKEYPDIFLPVISVHPYRRDAIKELEKWAKQGAKYIKWLPNAMGIDPSSPRIDLFYKKMNEYNMILLSHTGEEQAVDADEDQKLGNPLLLRRPLDIGIRVIMAHCASLGSCEDIESSNNEEVPCFDLFIRLMDDKKYEGLLFGDISAIMQYNRLSRPILTILERQDLHHRIVNGSDYPLPAINFLFQTGDLVDEGLITPEEAEYLNEIYGYNPLLFDFVLKRTIRHPQNKERLPASIFMENPGLGD